MVALGRLLHHDPRSRAFPVRAAPVIRSLTHRRYGAVLDQGHIGSCTGNALAQALNCVPLRRTGIILKEPDALGLYSRATEVDPYPGVYPPDDTGSSGLAVAKAAVEAGYISSYTHGFGLAQTLGGLMLAPCIVGTNWHSDMFYPFPGGVVHPGGPVVGGHEYLLFGVDVPKRMLHFLNSWGPDWGDRGRFHMSFEDFETLLAADGDATFPVR